MSSPVILIRIIGLILTLVFIFSLGKKNRRHKILAIFFLSSTIATFSISWHVLHTAPVIAVLSSHFTATLLLSAPLAYLYIRQSLEDRDGLIRKDSWHFLPSIIIFLGQLPYNLSSWEYKRSIIEKIQTNQVNYKEHQLNSFVTPQQFQLIFVAQVIVYLTLIWKKWISAKQHDQPNISSSSRVWLKWFTGVFTVNCLLSVSMGILRFNHIQNSLSINILQHVMEIGSMSFIFLNAVVLFAPILINLDLVKSLTEQKNKSTPKNFSPDYIQSIEEKLNAYIASKKFLEPETKINSLAEFTGIPLHHLSVYFNQHLFQSFPDWRNALRIIEAKQLITEGLCDDLNMEGLAQRVGFTNRSTFSVVFRKHTGVSPTDFSRQQNAVDKSKLTA